MFLILPFLLFAFVFADKKGNHKVCISFNCPRIRDAPSHAFGDHIVIANRNAGTISIVNQDSLETFSEFTLPDEGMPMYFGMSILKSEIWVGDRRNNRLVIIKMNGCKLEYEDHIEMPAGVFHSMITQRDDEYPIIVTTSDMDDSVTVIDLTTRRVLATIKMPDFEEYGFHPHDITTNGDYIFVTYVNADADHGWVASYTATDFQFINARRTKADPHVAIRDETDLFIAAQGKADEDGLVLKVSIPNLEILTYTARPSPHGMFISNDSKRLYTTNIADGDESDVDVWNVATGELLDCPVITTDFKIPHNPLVDEYGSRIFITHSGGTSTMNSAFDIDHNGCLVPESNKTFETDTNPFGLMMISPAAPLLQCSNA